jgi:small multidrug resistance pump
VGITYAYFAGVCIIATSLVGIIKFNQLPNIFTLTGLFFIIIGVLIVNLLGQS